MSEKRYLHHICLRVSNLKQSEVFYEGFLGLRKQYEFVVTEEQARILFNIPAECQFISFECPDGGGLEIFTAVDAMPKSSAGCHFCLAVADRETLLEKLKLANVEIRELAREDKKVVFITDPDNNLIELKEMET
jgi:catechol 2,3-dioxygenase-like lactoylglutathione lyase family enzyme